jgi:acyl-homoserine-lactone acylase
VLRDWDLHDDLDSGGAILFRRFAGRALGAAGGPFSTPFSPSDPVNTPRGLNTAHPQVRQALADAVQDLRDSNIPLDAPLRGFQYEERGDERIPIHGGPGAVGVFNAINVPFVKGQGYPDVPHGSSFVQAVRLKDACPDVSTILTYSQSANPESPFYADQTRMFSRKEWVDFPFCARDVRAKTLGITRLR